MIQSHIFFRNSAKQFFPIGLLPDLTKINSKILRQRPYNYSKLLTAEDHVLQKLHHFDFLPCKFNTGCSRSM